MLKMKDVWFSPEGNPILKGIDLVVPEGEILVIMGTSGAGKSTILRLLNGLIKPSRGEIEVDGVSIAHLSEKELVPIRQKVGMVFQFAALFDSMTIAENVGFAWRKEKISRDEMKRRIRETLRVVGLKDIENKMPSQLSGGMKKRVGLARAIAMNPKALLYDEPTSGLDPSTSNTILGLIKDLRTRLGVTSVVVTHDLEGAYLIGDRLALLHGGKLIFCGTKKELRACRDPVVQSFIAGEDEVTLP